MNDAYSYLESDFYRGLIGWFILLRNFSVAISVSLNVCFILSFNLDSYVSKIMH